jgi:hypothetical protein
MKKTFQLRVEGKHPDRLLEAIKHEIRKYIKRERRRDLPPDADYWDFDGWIGAAVSALVPIHPAALTAAIDAAVAAGEPQFHVELLARPARRVARPEGVARRGRDEATDRSTEQGAGAGTDEAPPAVA